MAVESFSWIVFCCLWNVRVSHLYHSALEGAFHVLLSTICQQSVNGSRGMRSLLSRLSIEDGTASTHRRANVCEWTLCRRAVFLGLHSAIHNLIRLMARGLREPHLHGRWRHQKPVCFSRGPDTLLSILNHRSISKGKLGSWRFNMAAVCRMR